MVDEPQGAGEGEGTEEQDEEDRIKLPEDATKDLEAPEETADAAKGGYIKMN